MPSPITKALSKLHLRRGSASASSNSPPSSPSRRSEDVTRNTGSSGYANASRQSLDQGQGRANDYGYQTNEEAPPLPSKPDQYNTRNPNLFTSQTGDFAPGQTSKQVGDVPIAAQNPMSPATIGGEGSGYGGSSAGGVPPVAATTRATGDEVPVAYGGQQGQGQASAISQSRRRSLSNSTGSNPLASRQTANNSTSPLPRSPAKFALPTIPPTPAGEETDPSAEFIKGSSRAPQLPPLSEVGQKSDLERSVLGSDGVAGVGAGANARVGSGTNADQREGILGSDGWIETDKPFKREYDLRPPSDLFPVTPAVPGARPIRSIVKGHHDQHAAYASTHIIGHIKTPTTEDEHRAHVAKHLALLPATIFGGIPLGASGRAFGPPGKIMPLQAGPAVKSSERDRVLTAQRQSLVTGIASEEAHIRESGGRAGTGPREVDARTKEVFERAGWGERLGVMDTVDIGTRVLEPVVQEHIRPVETVTYLLAIEREVHQYHIYPYIQPIRDPNPIILPTRHLFKDNDGNYREIIGDAAAELILGGPIDRSEGRIYYERWIEGVDGTEYQVEEENSVKVGRTAWVRKVGERVNVLPSRVAEDRLVPLPYQGVPASATTVGKSIEDVFGTSQTAQTTSGGATREAATGYNVQPTRTESYQSDRIGRAL